MKLLRAIKRLYKIAFCDHKKKVRIMTHTRLDFKICRKCGLSIFDSEE